MPRKSRIDASGALHHVITRRINRQEVFAKDVNRENFLDPLGDLLVETLTGAI